MCGVVGAMAVGNIPYNMEKWFKDALYIDGLRGMDSTGVMRISPAYEVSVNKKAMNPLDFLDLKSTDEIFKGSHRVLLGHNRWATKGAVNNQNAHPFTHKHITMVHNGSLTSFFQLKDHSDFTVDSEAICYSIAHDGAEETIKKLNGSFSLVWWDDDAKTMNFCRNDERPMYVSAVAGGEKIVFASEPEMITWLAGGKERGVGTRFEHEEPKPTEVGVLYTFDIGASEKGKKLVSMESKRIDLYVKPPATKYPRYDYDDENYGNGWDRSSRNKRTQRAANRKAANGGNKVVSLADKRGQPVIEKLKKFGLARGDEIEFNYLEHSVVGNTNRMIVYGTMPNYPFLPIKAYNLTSADYDFNTKLSGEIVSIIIDDKDPHPSIVINNVKPLEVDTFLEHLQDDEDIKTYQGFNGRELTEREFNNLTKEGCAQCQCDLDKRQHTSHVWLDTNTVLCEECESERQRYGSVCFPNL